MHVLSYFLDLNYIDGLFAIKVVSIVIQSAHCLWYCSLEIQYQNAWASFKFLWQLSRSPNFYAISFHPYLNYTLHVVWPLRNSTEWLKTQEHTFIWGVPDIETWKASTSGCHKKLSCSSSLLSLHCLTSHFSQRIFELKVAIHSPIWIYCSMHEIRVPANS